MDKTSTPADVAKGNLFSSKASNKMLDVSNSVFVMNTYKALIIVYL